VALDLVFHLTGLSIQFTLWCVPVHVVASFHWQRPVATWVAAEWLCDTSIRTGATWVHLNA
jgi:hypothetical protein